MSGSLAISSDITMTLRLFSAFGGARPKQGKTNSEAKTIIDRQDTKKRKIKNGLECFQP